jgi:hypothetical protein
VAHETHHDTANARAHPAVRAIGHCLAEMYEGYLHSPLPERFTALLDAIDEHDRGARPGPRRDSRARPR